MEKWKKWVNEIFIDGLGGMASGLFATLIIGTIIQQVGNLVPGTAGDCLFMMGKVAAAVTGAGIGCGVAVKLKASPLVMLSAATSGMMGAFAGKIMEGAVLVEGTICPFCLYCIGGNGRAGFWASDFCIYGMAWLNYQLGNHSGTVFYGDCCIRPDGYYPNASYQFCSVRHYLGSGWNRGRGCNRGMLCQHDWVCCGFL